MKKQLILFAASILALAGCATNQDNKEIDIRESGLSLFARTESQADTKTVVESGTHVYWEPGDEIAVFMGENSGKFTAEISGVSETATFNGTLGVESWPEELNLWAVYPYSEDAVFDGETITTTLPSEQIAREGSFGKDMNLSIAHSTSTFLQFYNVGGGIRFSVTEDDIKMIILEGTCGELLSGKIKIGLSDKGLPEVKEVVDGSQFISLYPPIGQETFNKDTWYYIVAIPSSLEGGYKMRFYKDSSYAKRTSETAVRIKRSVYGSITNADSGIEYEAQLTGFPETDEEWTETEASIFVINDAVQTILEKGYEDPTHIAAEAAKIDGIVSATLSQDEDIVYLKMSNGVYLNVLLNTDDDTFGSGSWGQSEFEREVPLMQLEKENTPEHPTGKNALVLVPVYNDMLNHKYLNHAEGMYNNIFLSLQKCGFDVMAYVNDKASYDKFLGSKIGSYDVVYINTHGTRNMKRPDGTLTIGLMTGTKLFDNSDNHKDMNWLARLSQQLYVLKANEDKRVSKYVSIEEYQNTHTKFNNTWLFLHVCYSLAKPDIYQYMLNNGAGACSGFTTETLVRSSLDFAVDLVDAFSSGMEVNNASEWATTHSVNQYGEKWVQGDNMNHFATYRNKNIDSFHLFDPRPYSLAHSVSNQKVTLSWKLPQHTGSYSSHLFVNDLEVATVPENSSNDYSYEYTANESGTFTWHVKADIMYKGDLIETHQSDSDLFTVDTSESPDTPDTPQPPVNVQAVDLGLSVKWATCNVGATAPEKYGDYFAWGETEPYYSSQDPLTWKDGKTGYNWASYKWCNGTYNSLTKYNTYSDYGTVDNKTVLDPGDDAAAVNWGGSWRMPTDAEWTELRTECNWTWTTHNGVNGRLVTGPNGNSIFLPAAGDRDDTGLRSAGSNGRYWSSSLLTGLPDSALVVDFFLYGVFRGYGYHRCYGRSVRPVTD